MPAPASNVSATYPPPRLRRSPRKHSSSRASEPTSQPKTGLRRPLPSRPQNDTPISDMDWMPQPKMLPSASLPGLGLFHKDCIAHSVHEDLAFCSQQDLLYTMTYKAFIRMLEGLKKSLYADDTELAEAMQLMQLTEMAGKSKSQLSKIASSKSAASKRKRNGDGDEEGLIAKGNKKSERRMGARAWSDNTD